MPSSLKMCFAGVVALFTQLASADKILDQLRGTAESYIRAVNSGDYKRAALHLHYPKRLTGKALEEEIRGISDSISILVDEFGVISDYRAGEAGKFLSLFVMAGSLDDWKNEQNGVKLTYLVDYGKEGKGYLFFQYSQIDSRLMLRTVEYGLPDDGIGTKARLGKVMARLLAVAP